MTMFKFRRSRVGRSAAGDDDDNEPMRGTSYKRGAPGVQRPSGGSNSNSGLGPASAASGAGGATVSGVGGGGRAGRPRSSSNPGSSRGGSGGGRTSLRNYSGNTRNKYASGQQQQYHHGASGKVSWISDNCSETDVTETWISDLYSSNGSDEGSSSSVEDGSSSRISEASGDVSRESGESGRGERDPEYHGRASGETHDTSCTSSGFSERSEEGSSSHYLGSSRNSLGTEGLYGDSYSEESGILFSPGEKKKVTGSCDRKYSTDDDASYESMGDQVKNNSSSGKLNKTNKKMPPPPPKRKNKGGGGGLNESASSLGDFSLRSGRSSNSRNGSNNNDRSWSNLGGKGRKNPNGRSYNKKASVESASQAASVATNNTGNTHNTHGTNPPNPNAKTNGPQGSFLEEQRLKPPSMKGMPQTANPNKANVSKAHKKLNKNQNHRRGSSLTASSGGEETANPTPPASLSGPQAPPGATAAASASEGTNATGGAAGTEAAAMQQLAYLVVSLRSDLRDANLARDELEAKVEDLEKKQTAQGLSSHAPNNAPGGGSGSNPYSDDNKVAQLEKENADLQADVDAFIAEQDELKDQARRLNEDKSSLNDIIVRLKRDRSTERCAAAAELKGAAVDARIDELTEENRKLEREIQLLVGEKSQLVSSSDSRTCEIEQLHKNLQKGELQLQEQELAAGRMQEKIDELEGELERERKECKENSLNVALLEDDLERKEEEMEGVKAELQSESNKMTLLRQRLSQVEKQKGEMADRNAAMDGVMMGLKKKMEEMLKERIATRQEVKDLREENVRMSDELKLSSVKAIAKEASEADTLLNLQKMIASLEEAKNALEEDLDHKDDELKLNDARISQLESQLRLAGEMKRQSSVAGLSSASSAEDGEDADALRERADALSAANKDLESKLQGLETDRAITEDELESLRESSDEEVKALAAANESLLKKVRALEDERSMLNDEIQVLKDSPNAGNDQAKENDESGTKTISEEERGASDSILQEQIVALMALNESLQSKVQSLEEEQASAEDELEALQESSAKEVAGLEASLNAKQLLSSQNQVTGLQKAVAQLEEEKDELDEEMNEATDAIAMLEDELDQKDAKVKELLVKLTMMQQQFSQADKCKTALAERNASLSRTNDDLSTQIKVLILEKNVASEEIETLKAMKTIADEDQEEALLRREECRQEVDDLTEKFEKSRIKSNEKISNLEQEVYTLEEQNMKLVQDLDEGNDALTMLREALKELEAGKTKKDASIKELKAKLTEKEAAVSTYEAVQTKLSSEHTVSVDTIATLQKMISSLEKSKDELEEELDASSAALIELKEQLKSKDTREGAKEACELKEKLDKSMEKNEMLSQRIVELNKANEKMKDQVKDLGQSLAKVTLRNAALQGPPPGALVPSSEQRSSPELVLPDPVTSCDALISELKNRIGEIVSARNAALEEIEHLRRDSASVPSSETRECNQSAQMIPPPADIDTLPHSVLEAPSTPVTVPGSKVRKSKSSSELPQLDSPHRPEESFICDDDKTMEKSLGRSLAPSHAGSRGSSLLEAAKKLCDQLDEKRSQEASEKTSGSASRQAESLATATASSAASKHSKGNVEPSQPVARQWEEETVKNVMDQDLDQDIDDNISAREVKEDSPKDTEKPGIVKDKSVSNEEDKKQEIPAKSSRTKGRFDIDQLTSIYFEKCGMSISKFSDLSSDSSSFRRRSATGGGPNGKNGGNTVTKKVKICRNGVFMGTYEGDLNPDGQRHGFGVLLCDNGNSYEGEWKKDKRDGLGIARYSSGDVYDGQWQRGKRQGHGVMYIEAGDTYIGSWNNGLKHGAGTYHWADGEVDVSWYQEDRRVGEGVRWNASRSKAYRLIRGTKKEELSLDEAYVTAEKLGLNLEKFDSGVP